MANRRIKKGTRTGTFCRETLLTKKLLIDDSVQYSLKNVMVQIAYQGNHRNRYYEIPENVPQFYFNSVHV